MLKVIAALVPSAGLLFLFWMALRALIQADRRERAAEAKWERAHGRVRAVEPGPGHAVPAVGGERPGVEEPGTEGPAAEGPAAEGPAAEGPAAEGPAAEGPAPVS